MSRNFKSDNVTPVCDAIMAAIQAANRGSAAAYGGDDFTRKLRTAASEVFAREVAIFPVTTGTAANALALAQCVPSYGAVYCHDAAHIITDECGAPEFFTGAKMIGFRAADGKIKPEQVAGAVAFAEDMGVHHVKPAAVSLSQATEWGTVYQVSEVSALAATAKQHGLPVHMDGARFANAVATLNCAPKEMTWQRGVDVLGFGGTKNGLGAGELVIFFKRESSREFDYRLKQAGQLDSKMRFLAAPWVKLLDDGLWLRNAQHANAKARKFADRLARETKIDIVLPVEANAVFVRLPEVVARNLQARRWHFYNFVEPGVYRLMCSWATTDVEIERFIGDVLRSAKESV